jgi:hypothetical protein
VARVRDAQAKGRLVRPAAAVYDHDRERELVPPDPLRIRESVVTSFVGVLGITVVLFFVVALTGRLILGR